MALYVAFTCQKAAWGGQTDPGGSFLNGLLSEYNFKALATPQAEKWRHHRKEFL